MTQIGTIYGNALYDAVSEEQAQKQVLEELKVLDGSFRQEPEFLRLLASAGLSKQERCGILDDSFRGKVHPYVLNFLKLLTEKGYVNHFAHCCAAFRDRFNEENNILPVTAVTAVPLSQAQTGRLTEKLTGITGKTIDLVNRIDPSVLGGMRLDYSGKRLDDTVAHRLEAVRSMLKNTVL